MRHRGGDGHQFLQWSESTLSSDQMSPLSSNHMTRFSQSYVWLLSVELSLPPRWRCDQARTQTDRLLIEWSSMKPVTLTCQIGNLPHEIFKRICCSLVILMENKTNLCIFSVGENLDVYRATLGHKVFQNHSLRPFVRFSIGSWQYRVCTTDPWCVNPDLDLHSLAKISSAQTLLKLVSGLSQFSAEFGDGCLLPS